MIYLHFKQGMTKSASKDARKFIIINLKTRLNNDEVWPKGFRVHLTQMR